MTTDPEQAWDIVPHNGRVNLELTEAGRFALPMDSIHNDEVLAHITIVLTGDQIETMYRQMRRLNSDDVASFGYQEPERRELKAQMGQW